MRQVFTESRRERRAEAKRFGLDFEPRYAKGLEPKTHLEMYGVGYERFDGHITVSDKVESRRYE